MLAERSDLIRRYGEEKVAEMTCTPLGVSDTQRLEQALADASAEVEAYLAGRYSLPIANAPEVIRRVTCDLAWYFLHRESVPEAVTERYQHAIALLKSIARGDVQLGLSAGGATPAPATGGNAELVSAAGVWERSHSQGFI